MPYEFKIGDMAIGSLLGGMDVATNASPLRNLIPSALVGAGGGALQAALSGDRRWGTHIGSSLLTTTATSAFIYYLGRGLVGTRRPHYYNVPPASWGDRVEAPADQEPTPAR